MLKEPMKSFKMRLPEALLKDLEEFATKDKRSIANFVRIILENFIKTERAKPTGGKESE
jgi:metal-responsive CopG/Arc/MetJ family transcriptional regulator